MKTTYSEILKQYWDYDSFRGVQEEIIVSIGEGHDTLGLMPTGGGKSICFQVPAMAMDGLCLVVTPLISLMKDQVAHLRMKAIKATAIHAGMSPDEMAKNIENCIFGNYKFLYVSPERLDTENFRNQLLQIPRICMICVDEAHCISQWGYDFRPSYLKIAELRRILPHHVPVLALTATATPKVIDDIQERLKFSEKRVFSMSFERKNLAYLVRRTENKAEETLHILRGVNDGSAIVYTRSRKLTGEIAKFLMDNGITADNYHAGLTEAERTLRQVNWTRGRNRVMVATNAFGMGIDKPDVRVVVHYTMPDSIEAYFQEAGRAGRDGKTSYAILLCNDHDKVSLASRVSSNFPEKDFIRGVYENMCCYLQVGEGEAANRTFNFSLEEFCRNFRYFHMQTDSALKILTMAGYIDYSAENDSKSRVKMLLLRDELYRLRNMDTDSDTLMRALMRLYTGLFADYVYVDETVLAHATGFSAEKVYNLLSNLRRQRIMDYIPPTTDPQITFMVPRVATEKVGIPAQVYDIRKREYEHRINEILAYAESEDTCRSRMLLRYFGEKDAEDCGVCDVCRKRSKAAHGTRHREQGIGNKEQAAIEKLLGDGEWHNVTELNSIGGNTETIDGVIHNLVSEEHIILEGNRIRRNNG